MGCGGSKPDDVENVGAQAPRDSPRAGMPPEKQAQEPVPVPVPVKEKDPKPTPTKKEQDDAAAVLQNAASAALAKDSEPTNAEKDAAAALLQQAALAALADDEKPVGPEGVSLIQTVSDGFLQGVAQISNRLFPKSYEIENINYPPAVAEEQAPR